MRCWEGAEDAAATCMLPDGHEGPHVFTPDDEIFVVFVEPEEKRWDS